LQARLEIERPTSQRKHEYATLEHLLLALIDDADASAVMRVCSADLGELAEKLNSYLDNELKRLVIDNGADCKPTAAFQRVAIARHAAVGPRIALYRAVESRPVMAADMMTRERVGRKGI
jgi:ATP-dependent Clp protease ATP-binding subunit ClpA